MSAAATAAGYLYASGRLRGKAARALQSERFTANSNAAPQPSTATGTAAPFPSGQGVGQGDVAVAAPRTHAAPQGSSGRQMPDEGARPAVAAPKRIPVVTYKKRRL